MSPDEVVKHRFLSAPDGTSLAYEVTRPPGTSRATVVLVHGFGEYSGRYGRVMEPLLASGMAVVRFDLRGHGQSAGRRGHVLHFEEYLDDLAAVLAITVEQELTGPRYLLGHSLGGLIVLAALASRSPEVAGAVVSSPFLGFGMRVPGWKAFLGNWLSKLIPSFSMPNGIDAADLCHDEAIVSRYRTDTLVHHVASARWFTETKATQAALVEQAAGITLPLLVLQAEDDRLVSLEATRRVYERLGSTDKQLKLYPGLFHEIFNEAQGPRIVEEVIGWIDKRIQGSQQG